MNIRSRYFRRYGLCRTAYEPLALVGRFEHPWGATPQLACSLTLPSSITVAHYSFGSDASVLARHFAFHVATVSSFTTLISRFHLTAVRLVIEHCLRSHTQTFKEGFMCLTGNLGFGFPSASFRSKLYLSSLKTLTSRLVS